MIPTPFIFESKLTPADFQKIGELSLRWSHIDHTVGNCLRVMLRIAPQEAVPMIFGLSLEQRMHRIRDLKAINPMPAKAETAFTELDIVLKGLQAVRNNVIHAILYWRDTDTAFHLRSKLRTFTKEQVFETEELTNYAAIAVLNLRYELGHKQHYPDEIPPPLPGRPDIPEFLRSLIQWPKPPKTAKPERQRRPSQS